MTATIEHHHPDGIRLRFVEGPRAGKLASQNIGKPNEATLSWPDVESARMWMHWQGHQEWQFDAMAYLKAQTTRELMSIRESCYRLNGRYDITENDGRCMVTTDQVLEVLAGREHIPNKAQAKAIRQAKAHAQRHH